MASEQRIEAFSRMAFDHVGYDPKTWRDAKVAGVSNSAMSIEDGLFLGTVNFGTGAAPKPNRIFSASSLLLRCIMTFPPGDEVHFAVVVGSGMPALKARLHRMRSLAEGGDRDYSVDHNNTRFYLASDGQLYLLNKEYWPTMHFDLSTVGPPIPIDAAVFSIYPPDASALGRHMAREFVGWLRRYLGAGKLHEIAWPGGGVLDPRMRRMPGTLSLDDIKNEIAALGGHYVDDLVDRFHVALNFHESKHFVILTGISGTGKSSLVRHYTHAVHGVARGDSDPFFFDCPVRPDWTDPAGLTGYYDVITNRFVVPEFLRAVLTAVRNPQSPIFVLLDEMNLARVEYYFSDVLSAMESGRPLQLHTSAVAHEGSTGDEIPATISLPANLYIVGTVNIDETTHAFSDKVLDRAVVIDMSSVDLDGYFTALKSRHTELTATIDVCKQLLNDVNALLVPHNLGFGYRTAEEFIRYCHASTALGRAVSTTGVMDEQLVQKVLVRLRGTHEQEEMLDGLQRLFAPSYPRAGKVVTHLIAQLNEVGSFHSSR